MKSSSKIEWHKLLGELLKGSLSPVDIQVSTDVSVMSKSPEIDIILLKRKPGKWTPAQLALLPDGIRDTQVTDILLEFKYTESLSEKAVQQTVGYYFFIKHTKRTKNKYKAFY